MKRTLAQFQSLLAQKAPGGIAGPAQYRQLWLPDLLMFLAFAVPAAAVFQIWPELDLRLMQGFYEPAATHHWPHGDEQPWVFFYKFTPIMVVVLAIGTLGLLIQGYRRREYTKYRIHCYTVILLLALGPGVVVNLAFKDNWGRFRPRDVVELGGRQPFTSALAFQPDGWGKSFPCGHCSVGFAFAIFYFLFRRHKRHWARFAGLASGLVIGTMGGIGRAAAGGHFPSDVLWAFLMVFCVAWGLYYFVLNVPGCEDAPAPETSVTLAQQWRSLVVVGLLFLGVALGALLATPKKSPFEWRQAQPPDEPYRLLIECRSGDLELRLVPGAGHLQIDATSEGFGFMSTVVEDEWQSTEGDVDQHAWRVTANGALTELATRGRLQLPADNLRELELHLDRGSLHITAPPGHRARLILSMDRGNAHLPASWAAADHQLDVPQNVRENIHFDVPPLAP